MRGVNSDSIDLIYLDPPFNKSQVYTASVGSEVEGASFRDCWDQYDVEDDWYQLIAETHPNLYAYLSVMKNVSIRGAFYYLWYISIRLVECYRVLKDTGSVYLHCDPVMSHYLKILMDYIFGTLNFRNEIVWCYKWGGSNSRRRFKTKHDVILRYSKTDAFVFNMDDVLVYGEASGWKGADQGRMPNDWWSDIPSLNTQARERIGYPTQKPLALLERIIKASSNEGDVVLDPFCGCSTTCIAAERLNRKWVGIDIYRGVHQLVRERLGEWSCEVSMRTDVPIRDF